ncbi:MAG TPA: ANTAR domain-containing protein [Candidatus Acidoferrum sp.]|nr:ANTAR domain-containing protein [Candidatus Acidoferrum sp.]
MIHSIMLVHPDDTNRPTIMQSLNTNGLRNVVEAADPDEAMRLAVTTEPDIALISTALEGDAIQLVGRLASEHGIPSVLLAQGNDELLISQAAASGAMGLLVSPLNTGSLQAVLEMAVIRFRDIRSLRREGDALRRALEDRKVIDRAKGLLMEMEGLSEQEAYARIRQKSMDTQRHMAEIARAIILATELRGKGRRSEVSLRS